MTHRFACGAVLLVTVSEVSSLILFCSAPLQVCARRRLLLHQSITFAAWLPRAHTWLPRSNLPVVWADRFYSEGNCRLGGLGDLDVMSQCKSLSGQKDALLHMQSSCNQQWDSERDRCETHCSLCYRQTKFKVDFLSFSLFPVTYILLQWRKLQIMRAVHLYIIPMIQKLRLHTAPNAQFQTDSAPFLALKKRGSP